MLRHKCRGDGNNRVMSQEPDPPIIPNIEEDHVEITAVDSEEGEEYLDITDLIRQESIPLSDINDTLDQLMNLLEGNSSLQHPVYSLLINDTLA